MSAGDVPDASTARATASGAPLGIPATETRSPAGGPAATQSADIAQHVPNGSARPRRSRWRRLRRIPVAAWICALVAIVNAVSWSVISPPFQLPDESDHFAYVEHLAETGHLPSSSGQRFSAAEQTALVYLLHDRVRFSQENHTISSREQQQQLEAALALPEARDTPGAAGVAASEPPLYYALETVPYLLGSGGTLLDSLVLMRLLS